MAEKNNLAESGGRRLKKRIREMLASGSEMTEIFAALEQVPARKLVNPLFACFYDRSPLVKWRAVAVMGRAVAQLAQQHRESARVIMRRLTWNLNDESGGIGWGSPEAMAEIMVQHSGLADEYARMLTSYVFPNQNFLEHPGLQRGVIWALGRLAQGRPELVADAAPGLLPFLGSPDAFHRGYAAWALGNIKDRAAADEIEKLHPDTKPIEIFRNFELVTTTVGRLAQEALAAIANGERSC